MSVETYRCYRVVEIDEDENAVKVHRMTNWQIQEEILDKRLLVDAILLKKIISKITD